MKKTRLYLGLTSWLIAIMLLAVACDNDLEIKQEYDFDLVTMPVQKQIRKGETAEIRCSLVKQGDYKPNQYKIRYFQSDGSGKLQFDNGNDGFSLGNGLVLKPNDLYPLEKSTFRLYYTSRSETAQTIDVFIEDSFGKVVQKTFSWQSDRSEEDSATHTK